MQTVFSFIPIYSESFRAVQIHVFSDYFSSGYWELFFCFYCWSGSQGLMCGRQAICQPPVGSCAPLVHPYRVSFCFLIFPYFPAPQDTPNTSYLFPPQSRPAMSLGALVPWYYKPRPGHKVHSLLWCFF